MIEFATDETYDQLTSEGTVIADFFSKTCIPCKMIARVLEEIDDEFPFVTIVKVDVEECPKVSERFHINGIPDLYFYQDGKLVHRELGAVDETVIRDQIANMLY